MSAASSQLRVHLRHRGLVFWSFFVPVIFLIPLTVFVHIKGRGAGGISLFTLFSLATATAFFLSSAQQELLSKGQCFLMPALRRGMLRNLASTGLGVAVLSLAAAYLVPGLAAIIQGSATMAWSVACLMVFVFALTLMVVFQFNYASWLPFQMIWIISIGMKSLLRISPDQIRILLGQTTLLSLAAGIMVFLFWRQIRSRATLRKLAQRPFISIADLRNMKRIENFKRARDQHKVHKNDGIRPLYGLMQAVNRRAVRKRSAGHRSRALVWESIYLALTNLVPRKRNRLALMAALLLAALVLFGYYDSRALLRENITMQGWFSGFVFMGVLGVVAMPAYHLRVPTLGRLCGRREMLRAGWIGAGVMLAMGVAVTALFLVAGHLLAGVLPGITVGNCTYFMVGPRLYLLGSSLFILPIQLIVLILWRRPGPHTVLTQSATLSFFFYHVAFNAGGVNETLPVAIPVIGALWLALTWIWRWRVLRTDLV